MNDLISRQAAIDAVVTWTVEDRPDIEMPTDLVARINALPSVQVRTQMSSADCISRQAAIDALAEEWYHDVEDYRTAVSVVGNLPSAQPERCKGEWIDSNNIQVGWDKVDKSCPADSCKCSNCGEWLVASDEYCVKGNFCPICGADMRGENNETN